VGVASPALKQPIFMKMKFSQISLVRHPLNVNVALDMWPHKERSNQK
jgi:hypothetical protein